MPIHHGSEVVFSRVAPGVPSGTTVLLTTHTEVCTTWLQP